MSFVKSVNSASEIPAAEGRIGTAPVPALVVASLSAVAAAGLLFVALPGWLRGLLAVVCLAGGAVSSWRLLRPRWRDIRCDGQRLWLRGPRRLARSGRVLGRPFVSPFYLGFLWRDDASGRPASIGLFREQLDGRAYRRLSTLLRHRVDR